MDKPLRDDPSAADPPSGDMYSFDEHGKKVDAWIWDELLSEDDVDEGKYRHVIGTSIDLGGKGSGNFGHKGRPGEVGGSSPGDGGSTAAPASTGADPSADSHPHITAKREAFHAMVSSVEAQHDELETLRVEMIGAWKAWEQDTRDRPKPLKPDGAAAKKLDSYKRAQELEKAFHAQHDAVMRQERAVNKQAREMLKVPPEDRSDLTFRENANAPLHPAVLSSANRVLENFRQFDGSGAFDQPKMTAEQADNLKTLFGGKTDLQENPDGTFSFPSALRVSQAASSRASADIGGINLRGGSELDRQVNHEVAHHIEFKSSAILKAAVEFREARADKPREVYKLNTVNPSLNDDEIAVRGKFPDSYSAKIYPHDVATEIVSTGVEFYMQDPVSFAQRDPEHFNFIFDLMHGKYRPR